MTKHPTSFRLSDLTTRQLAELISATGLTQSEVMSTAINNMHREEVNTMQSKMYSVKVNGDTLYHDLFKNEAIKIARDEAAQGNQVFISWFRKTDGQTGYLNSDGNHDITGTAW